MPEAHAVRPSRSRSLYDHNLSEERDPSKILAAPATRDAPLCPCLRDRVLGALGVQVNGSGHAMAQEALASPLESSS
jgi:hypothetical protein